MGEDVEDVEGNTSLAAIKICVISESKGDEKRVYAQLETPNVPPPTAASLPPPDPPLPAAPADSLPPTPPAPPPTIAGAEAFLRTVGGPEAEGVDGDLEGVDIDVEFDVAVEGGFEDDGALEEDVEGFEGVEDAATARRGERGERKQESKKPERDEVKSERTSIHRPITTTARSLQLRRRR